MRLSDILQHRKAVNLLKAMYDREFIDKTAHTVTLSELLNEVRFTPEDSIDVLSKSSMVTVEDVNGEIILSLSHKGKLFIEAFDKLKDVFDGAKKPQKAFMVEYNLTALEMRVLVLCFKMQQETGRAVLLKTLSEEVYPYKRSASSSTVSKYVTKLEKLNLMKKDKVGGRVFVEVTRSGENAIKNQSMSLKL